MPESSEQSHRRSDDKLEELYDALIGTPTRQGFIDETRTMLKENGRRLDDHLAQHKKNDDAREERNNDVFRALFDLTGKVILAVLGVVMGMYVSVNTFLHKGP